MAPPNLILPNRQNPAMFRGRPEQMRSVVSQFPICLVTGGAGYIGSHTVLELLTAGFAVVVIDNLSNSHMESLCRVHYIARTEFERCGEGARPVPPIYFHQVDIRNFQDVDNVFAFWQEGKALDYEKNPIDIAAMVAKKAYPMLDYTIDTKKRTKLSTLADKSSIHGRIVCVIHFAALKAVGESLSMPLDYYEVNVAGLLFILKAMKAHHVETFVFSSSAVVYGKGHGEAITEEGVQVAGQGSGGGLLTNPYGRSKWMSEEIINDFCVSTPSLHATSLRYFNPTGAHPSGLIGENPKGQPNNIVPVILQAYERRRSRVHVFGSSYDTPDGTGVRDYIHVSDLAKGHLAALRKAVNDQEVVKDEHMDPTTQYHVYNLGTGRGYSVLDIIKAFSAAAGTDVPFTMGEARAGDLGTVTASPEKAATELDWSAEFDLQDMCRDVFNWAAANPGGYEKLRRLSTMSGQGMSRKEIRRQSVASHLFESDEDFDNFMADMGNGGVGAANNSNHHMSSAGNRRPSSWNRASIASLSNMLQRTRFSVSSNSSDDAGSSVGPTSSALSSAGLEPPSPFSTGLKQPRFNMNWNDSSAKAPMHTELEAPIEEEEPAA